MAVTAPNFVARVRAAAARLVPRRSPRKPRAKKIRPARESRTRVVILALRIRLRIARQATAAALASVAQRVGALCTATATASGAQLRAALPVVTARLDIYWRLMRMHKPIGAFLLLWPTLWALWIAAAGRPDPRLFVIFIIGVFVMRSAGCVMNDIADRHFDPHVERTRERPLAAREIGVAEALALFFVLIAIAFALVLATNRLTLLLAFAGVALAVSYPFMKRYTWLPQPYLGMAFGWAIPMAYAAQANALPPVVWMLFIANIFWATAYDTLYAMVDRDDDLKIGVKSTAILFGDNDRLMVAILHAVVLLDLALVGRQMHLHAAFYWGLVAAAAFAVYEQWLIRKRRREACFAAFMNNNWFGGAIFVGLALSYIFR